MNDAAVAVTGSLKVTVIGAAGHDAGRPSAGVLPVTLGAASPGPAVVKLKLWSDGRVVGRVVRIDVTGPRGECGDRAAYVRGQRRSG